MVNLPKHSKELFYQCLKAVINEQKPIIKQRFIQRFGREPRESEWNILKKMTLSQYPELPDFRDEVFLGAHRLKCYGGVFNAKDLYREAARRFLKRALVTGYHNLSDDSFAYIRDLAA